MGIDDHQELYLLYRVKLGPELGHLHYIIVVELQVARLRVSAIGDYIV